MLKYLLNVIFFVFFACISMNSFSQEEDTLRVLFFGNSITLTNSLPSIFESIVENQGKNIEIGIGAKANHLLDHLLDVPSSMNTIDDKQWDYVVLQLTPGTFAEAIADSEFAISEFVKLIKENNPCSRILFFMPWKRATENDQAIEKILIGTTKYANEYNSIICPAGMVWSAFNSAYPGIELYTDWIHPTTIGSYLASCALYSTIYQESSATVSFYGGLTEEEAIMCQSVSDEVVLNDLVKWNITFEANFDYTLDHSIISIKNSTNTASEYRWDFGDDNISSLPLPSHTYNDTGIYEITLIVHSDSCLALSDTLSKTIQIHSIKADLSDIEVMPNPFQDELYIDLVKEYEKIEIDIYTNDGKKIYQQYYENTSKITLSLYMLNSGIYLLNMRLMDDELKQITTKLIKIEP